MSRGSGSRQGERAPGPAFIDTADRPYVPIDELTVSWAEYRELIEADRKQADASKPKPAKKATSKSERTLIEK
jgi:hypothetical protein